MSTYLADSRGFAHRLAADPAFSSYLQRPAEPARVLVRERLQHYAQSNPDVRQAMLLDAEGTEQVGTDARGAGRSHAMRPYLREALTGRAYTGDVVAGSEERDSGVYCAEPVRAEGGAVVGVLVIRVAAAVLDRQLAEARQDERVTPFLVDADGVFIRHPHADLQYRSLAVLAPDKQAEIRADQRFRRDQITSVDEVELAQALIGAKKAGHLAYDSAVTGRAMLAGYAPVAGHDWVVGVTEPSASAQAALQRTQIWLLAGAGAVGLLATAAAWLLARRIVQPLRALTRAAREVEAGDYTDPHLELDGPDEAGEMTRAFKSMVAALRQRERGRLGPRP
jgi:C4-dicarboxylate-specific signal transduction histidine kinase